MLNVSRSVITLIVYIISEGISSQTYPSVMRVWLTSKKEYYSFVHTQSGILGSQQDRSGYTSRESYCKCSLSAVFLLWRRHTPILWVGVRISLALCGVDILVGRLWCVYTSTLINPFSDNMTRNSLRSSCPTEWLLNRYNESDRMDLLFYLDLLRAL